MTYSRGVRSSEDDGARQDPIADAVTSPNVIGSPGFTSILTYANATVLPNDGENAAEVISAESFPRACNFVPGAGG